MTPEEQERALEERRADMNKQWKIYKTKQTIYDTFWVFRWTLAIGLILAGIFSRDFSYVLIGAAGIIFLMWNYKPRY